MDRFTVKQPNELYCIFDVETIQEVAFCDEDNKNWESFYEGTAINKLGKYEDLEEQGRLLILPCKIGDRIYKVVPDLSVDWPDPPEYKVVWDTFKPNDIYEFGKKIFLTREEAEKAAKSK